MKKISLIILMIFVSSLNYAQNCDCFSNLKWLIETFEKNDAGFQYVIDQKGENAYNYHNKTIKEKALKIKDKKECLNLLNEWTEFFRKGHIGVRLISSKNEKDLGNETLTIDLVDFNKNLENLKDKTDIEGIWVSSSYTIGIVRDSINPDRDYVGFIIKSGNNSWKINQIKFELNKKDSTKFTMNYYMGDHSLKKINEIELKEGKYLVSSFITFIKTKPEIKIKDVNKELYYKSIISEYPFVEKISNNTILLRIPSFMYENKKIIDAVLNENDSLIRNTKNLIIDLRNNGGGADRSYSNLIPYLYTNPYRVIGVERLSTDLNNQRIKDGVNNPKTSEKDRKWGTESLEKLEKNINGFVTLGARININIKDTVYPFPQNVAILINENCGSTTEQFLLAAKQSKKVKLFGTTTAGALDISNLNIVKSPCNDFELIYGTSKSLRIPEMTIDDKGIQPDFYFDKTIKPYEWIKKTIEILNYE
ncbi:MAG: S41 family peptidase [Flavobacteriaceae bacterium]|nr:S41 family peptidase [Flavobacteriaceae bacterium]